MFHTPCYVIDQRALVRNLEILRSLQRRSGCRILLAQKAFSTFALYPLIGEYLAGTASSGWYELRLGREEMGDDHEHHVYSPAYREEEFDAIVQLADHVIFNSIGQVRRYADRARRAGRSVGLRLNPECSTQSGPPIYDPCSRGSRLGVTRNRWEAEHGESILPLLDGFHFHTLCEQDADALAVTLRSVESQFGEYFRRPHIRWLNLGGGHHLTRPGYQMELLEECISHLQSEYQVTVYLEPGEAVALSAGSLHTTVLETLTNGIAIAILDTSAACHMPDVLEMPYRPPLRGSGLPDEKAYTYRLGGPTCLAGDVIGDYSFDQPLRVGDRLIFDDMAIYTMVKTNTFNGIPLPSIVLWDGEEYRTLREFGYPDFRTRLGE
ncbi:MAG: carboxynorspermidine decarboxylase [Planctomycetia bacterium]|nr:carboxynorspermidine decarboxylase [Planctomycetia bacterium]